MKIGKSTNATIKTKERYLYFDLICLNTQVYDYSCLTIITEALTPVSKFQTLFECK